VADVEAERTALRGGSAGRTSRWIRLAAGRSTCGCPPTGGKSAGSRSGGVVILVTSDLNRQTKADAAGLPYLETPLATASLQAKLQARILPAETGGKSAHVELSNAGRSFASGASAIRQGGFE